MSVRTFVCQNVKYYISRTDWPIINSKLSWDFRRMKQIHFFSNSWWLSRNMRFPTMWYVWPATAQTSLCIRAVWSEPLLVAWMFYDCCTTDCIWAKIWQKGPSGNKKQKWDIYRERKTITENLKRLSLQITKIWAFKLVNMMRFKHDVT